MNSFTVAASFLAAVAAPPGEANTFDLQLIAHESRQLALPRTGLALPVVNYVTPDGKLRRKTGIIAGVQVAPRTMVGIGFFETAKKRRSSNDGMAPEKRSKRAAVGVSFQF